MSYWSYLKSCAPAVFIMVTVAIMCAFVLAVSGVSQAIALLVCGMVLVASAVVNVATYLGRRSFYASLTEGVREIEHPSWVVEMLDRPGFVEGEIVYDALRAVSKAANDDIAAYRRQVIDYREYVETWVHETKTPLAAAHLMVENLTESAHSCTPNEVLDKADAIEEELDRLERYIEQALFFARSETIDRDYLIRSHSLKDLVTAAIKANARIMIAGHVAPMRKGLDLDVFTDDKWMEFILGQLIQNSVKYARPKGAIIEFTGSLLDPGRAEERVELAVRDNGCGVPAADLPRVFDRGFTGQNGRTGKRSTGIGLYLVKRLCDKMGIGVRADSAEGTWFCVTLTFPANKMHYFER